MTRPISPRHSMEPGVFARQEQVAGHEQDAYSESKVVIVGAGGIGGEAAHGMTRKGIGVVTLLDPDRVEVTNLTRQHFYRKDLGKYKAPALVRNLSKEATGSTSMRGVPMSFQDALDAHINLSAEAVLCGVDNDETRVEVARHYLRKTPVVFVGTSNDADAAYVFVQEPGKVCFACQFPGSLESRGGARCVPSEIGILKAISGFALYAIDSLLMSRPRHWNYRAISMSGSWDGASGLVKRRRDCGLCGRC